MNRIKSHFANGLATFTALICLGSGVLVANENAMERFRSEYPRAAKNFEELEAGPIMARVHCVYEGRGEIEQRVYYLGGLARKELTIRGTEQVICVSKQMAFSAFRDSGGPWQLTAVDQRSSDNIYDLVKIGADAEQMDAICFFRPHYVANGRPLKQWLESPDCSLVDASELIIEDTSCIEVELEFSKIDGSKYTKQIAMDPVNNWRIVREKFKLSSGQKSEQIVEYNDQAILPSKVTLTYDGKFFRSFEFLEWDKSTLAAEPFTPEYYGFPGMTPPSRGFGFRSVAGLLVLVCLVAGIFLWGKKR